MSAASDDYERKIADVINNSSSEITASRPKVSTSYPDVLVEYKNHKGLTGGIWVEVKMNHTDNLMNTRFQYKNGVWEVIPSYVSPASNKLVEYLNASNEAKIWIKGLKKYLIDKNWPGDVNKMSLYSSTTARAGDKNSVSLQLMKGYLSTLTNKNICKVDNVDIGKIAMLHYTTGKAVKTSYISSGDDLYCFDNNNPFGFKNIPSFEKSVQSNSVVFRIGDRSSNFEIQSEVKAKTIAKSPYSIKPGSSKPNPFKQIK